MQRQSEDTLNESVRLVGAYVTALAMIRCGPVAVQRVPGDMPWTLIQRPIRWHVSGYDQNILHKTCFRSYVQTVTIL